MQQNKDPHCFQQFLLQTRVKYVAFIILILFFLILYLTSHDHSQEEAEIKLINQKRIWVDVTKVNKPEALETENKKEKDSGPKFLSGKELAEEIDNEKKTFQMHTVKIINSEKELDLVLGCRDPFTHFAKELKPGENLEFRVTDLFSKRHYWCTGSFPSTPPFTFAAYGEAAPRDDNLISVFLHGAFINGQSVIKNEVVS